MNLQERKGYIQYLIDLGATFVDIIKKEQIFIVLISSALILIVLFYQNPSVAMWLGFSLAAYSAIANDSIQTIGTFIASNKDKKWWHLWLYIGLIFVGTVTVGWIINNGDVSYGRLLSKGFEQSPREFTFLQVAAPVVLLVITRLRMPVSTTFLLLSCFATDASAISGVLQKSASGYIIAFVVGFLVWISTSKLVASFLHKPAHPGWLVAQWLSSGILWAVWIMQDAANIAVFLPRSLHFFEFLAFTLFIFFGLALLFYLKGDKIQQIVEEKSSVTDVRPATIIDFVYACIMIFFTAINPVPMSTTWVFIGLLAGRELGMYFAGTSAQATLANGLGIIGKDIVYAFLGLAISIIMASLVNNTIYEELKRLVGL